MLVSCDKINILIYISRKVGQGRRSGDGHIYYVPEIHPGYISKRKAHIYPLKEIHVYDNCGIICDFGEF